jgi:hypothetical protein
MVQMVIVWPAAQRRAISLMEIREPGTRIIRGF